MSTYRIDHQSGDILAISDAASARFDALPPEYADWKHALDKVLAAPLLVLLGPAILLAALLVKATSPGPAFYRQVRAGRYGRRFLIYKLRTMYDGSEHGTGPVWSPPGDCRVTPVGSFLRKTHVDEFPQLWNVLRGEMALVGPRPERPEIIARLEREVPAYRVRLAVRPGLTGLAQVFLPPDLDVGDVRRKLGYDLRYVGGMGPVLDLKVLLCTASFLLGIPFRTSRRLLRLGGLAVGAGGVEAPAEAVSRGAALSR